MIEQRHSGDRALYRKSLPLLAGAGVAIALLAANVAITSRNIHRLQRNTQQVAHTYERIASIEDVVSLAVDAETGQRGFLLTGESAYLEPYSQAVDNIGEALQVVDRLFARDPRQQARALDMNFHTEIRLSELADTIALRQNSGLEAAQKRVFTNEGRREMDAIRSIADQMIQTEQVALEARSQQAEQTYRTAVFTGLFSGLLALAALLAFLTALRKYLEARQQAAASMQASEQRFRQITNAMPQMVWVTRPDGYHEYYNRRWYDYIGCTPEECIGFGWNAPLHPDDRQVAIDRWQHSLRTGEPYEIEYRFRSKEGEYCWFLARALPVRDETGRITQWFGTCTDIEENKRTEAERRQLAANLAEANHRKDEFLATLAHELRNPLAPIRNGLKILRLTAEKRGERNETTERIQSMMERQLAQMVRLIDELMDVSRISRGKVVLCCEVVELASMVEQSVETSLPAIEAAKHNLTVILPPQPVYLYADPVRLVQVFSNLLSNACRYSQPGSEIFVEAQQVQPDEITVVVRDTGIGISAEMLPKIFDLFTQVQGALERASAGMVTSSQGGLGIGLTLVKQLVEMHNGSVNVSSEGIGKGSEFAVHLPTTTQPIQGKTQPSTASYKL